MKFLRTLFFLVFTAILSIVGTVYILEKKIPSYEKKDTHVENSAKNESSFSFSDFLAKHEKSILYISASDKEEKGDFLESKHGTGFLFSYKGDRYILTNEHVASAPFLFADLGKEQFVPLKLIGKNAEQDIAVLQFEKKSHEEDLPALSLGNSSNLRLGETVYTIGFPLDIGFTASQGVLSGMNKKIDVESKSFSGLLQTDAVINPGNSGGPLIDQSGKVVGVNVASTENAQGIGFSIPIDTVVSVMDDILKKGPIKPGFLGIQVQEEGDGLRISNLIEKSPAEKSGLQKGDLLLRIEKKEIRSREQLQESLSMHEAGETISVEISRDDKTEVFPITLDEKK